MGLCGGGAFIIVIWMYGWSDGAVSVSMCGDGGGSVCVGTDWGMGGVIVGLGFVITHYVWPAFRDVHDVGYLWVARPGRKGCV